MTEFLFDFWGRLLALAGMLLAVGTAGHAIMRKQDPAAATAWVLSIILLPFVGPLLYLWLGINRIHKRARRLRRGQTLFRRTSDDFECLATDFHTSEVDDLARMATLVRLVDQAVDRPLLEGNAVHPLVDGDEAYPAMLAAIDGAEQTVSLSTYIFDNDAAGRRFVQALARAVERGVKVRVLVDGVGVIYSWPPIVRGLRKAGVPTAVFMRTLVPWLLIHSNLRNHRKILVVDGRIGFTGGINIRACHEVQQAVKHQTRDLQFQFEGPIVAHLQEVFAADWEFTTGEVLEEDEWFPDLTSVGSVLARGIPDGPDEDLGKLRMTILGALACAQKSVRIMTPYFLPDPALRTALQITAMRGVQIDIVLPENNNLPYMHWASRATWDRLLEKNCRIWLSTGWFDHSKLTVIDDVWTLVGSGNWDPRSFRMNFEFNVECYDRELGRRMAELVDERISRARRVFLEEIRERSLIGKLRDSVTALFSPAL